MNFSQHEVYTSRKKRAADSQFEMNWSRIGLIPHMILLWKDELVKISSTRTFLFCIWIEDGARRMCKGMEHVLIMAKNFENWREKGSTVFIISRMSFLRVFSFFYHILMKLRRMNSDIYSSSNGNRAPLLPYYIAYLCGHVQIMKLS